MEDNVIQTDVDGCWSSRDQSGAGCECEERSEVHGGGVLYTDYVFERMWIILVTERVNERLVRLARWTLVVRKTSSTYRQDIASSVAPL